MRRTKCSFVDDSEIKIDLISVLPKLISALREKQC